MPQTATHYEFSANADPRLVAAFAAAREAIALLPNRPARKRPVYVKPLTEALCLHYAARTAHQFGNPRFSGMASDVALPKVIDHLLVRRHLDKVPGAEVRAIAARITAAATAAVETGDRPGFCVTMRKCAAALFALAYAADARPEVLL